MAPNGARRRGASPGRRASSAAIVREPLGVVLDLPAWNYPLLTAVNCVVPAVLAGNAVIVKHSPRTPLCGEHFARAFRGAGAPTDLVQALHCDHPTSERMVGDARVDHVVFTGRDLGGHRDRRGGPRSGSCTRRLELGGNDPAYVAPDCDLDEDGRERRRRRDVQRRPELLRGRAGLRAPLALRALRRDGRAARARLRDGRSDEGRDDARPHRAAAARGRARGARGGCARPRGRGSSPAARRRSVGGTRALLRGDAGGRRQPRDEARSSRSRSVPILPVVRRRLRRGGARRR